MVNAKITTSFALVILIASLCEIRSQTRSAVASGGFSAVEVASQPGAVVWIDGVKRGIVNDEGHVKITKVATGRHILRVRASGFTERAIPITSTARTVSVPLIKTSDPGELAFQQAESIREGSKDDESRRRAVDLYRQSIKTRPANIAAHIGLARVLADLGDTKAALAEIDKARIYRPDSAEASAVEGRINRSSTFLDRAIDSFKRSIREGHGFQPEAHTGLAMVYEEQDKSDLAAREFQTAIDQLSDTEPVIYQLLGAVYEKQEKYKEAVAAYDRYLVLAPNGSLAPAVRSMIDQLRKQAAGEQILP